MCPKDAREGHKLPSTSHSATHPPQKITSRGNTQDPGQSLLVKNGSGRSYFNKLLVWVDPCHVS
jgi:hypothetical protein